ncbi:MAG: helix-turn-helix domain-containing protein [Dermatophilaceae bacterium]
MKLSNAHRGDVNTLSEQNRSPNNRDYQMRKRADDMAMTRQRIVEAAVRLHGTIGPAATTVSALAEEAQVTRLTVYRHFPHDVDLFAACSKHWASGQVLPDSQAWSKVGDPELRLHSGLSDLYRFYRAGEPMLTNVRRDRASLPAELLEQTDATDAKLCEVLLKPFAVRGNRRKRLRAVIGHAVSFWTWRSLCLEQGLSNREATAAMTTMVMATARQGRALGRGSHGGAARPM